MSEFVLVAGVALLVLGLCRLGLRIAIDKIARRLPAPNSSGGTWLTRPPQLAASFVSIWIIGSRGARGTVNNSLTRTAQILVEPVDHLRARSNPSWPVLNLGAARFSN